MHYKVAIIGQNPLGILITFNAGRLPAGVCELFPNSIGDGLDLPLVSASTDYEIVGEGSKLAKIQNTDVRTFFRLGGSNGSEPERGLFGNLEQANPSAFMIEEKRP